MSIAGASETRCRIAFLTPEFVTDFNDGGGLGNYLHRMGLALVERGHDVDVFLASYRQPAELKVSGISVHRVWPAAQTLGLRTFGALCRWSGLLGEPFKISVQARNLANAMERQHAVRPFDVVQSADFLAVGSAVQRRAGRVHLVRCSSAADLYNAIDQRPSLNERWRARLERSAMRGADRAYAPSRFLAEHFRRVHGMSVEVLRPPAHLEVAPAAAVVAGLPSRYLVHFGQLRRRKGTFWLLDALRGVFAQDDSLCVVLVGAGEQKELAPLLAALGTGRSRVTVLEPLPKPQLYAIVQRAEAAVLPSLVDNLPNTVIESLLLGVPVIGTRGGSVDELIEDGKTGVLVASGDIDALANAMLQVWRGQGSLRKGFAWPTGATSEMLPERAVAGFFRLVCGDRCAS